MNPTSKLATRALGQSGVVVSVVGLGTVKFGRDSGLKYPKGVEPVRLPSDAEARQLLDAAEVLGINLLDTAPAYGKSEERLGELLRGRTHPWIVVTKAGETWDGATSSFDFSKKAIRASIERSRERLGASQLGCVLIHSDGVAEKETGGFSGAIGALTGARANGDVRLIGASVKSFEGAVRALEWADVLMLEFGGAEPMQILSERAGQKGVGILAKKALASGHLEKLGPDPIRGAMKRTLAIPGVCSIVVGTTNIGHLQENCEAAAQAADELARARNETKSEKGA